MRQRLPAPLRPTPNENLIKRALLVFPRGTAEINPSTVHGLSRGAYSHWPKEESSRFGIRFIPLLLNGSLHALPGERKNFWKVLQSPTNSCSLMHLILYILGFEFCRNQWPVWYQNKALPSSCLTCFLLHIPAVPTIWPRRSLQVQCTDSGFRGQGHLLWVSCSSRCFPVYGDGSKSSIPTTPPVWQKQKSTKAVVFRGFEPPKHAF